MTPIDTAVAPDGSPVEFYRRVPGDAEAAIVHEAVPAGAVILELGCGAGRVTHPLLALGHPVVGVDNSAAMLAHVKGAETHLADIAGLDLDRRFPVVVLASNLVNITDDEVRSSFLEAAARHVEPDGVVLIQRYPPGWIERVGPWEQKLGDVVLRYHDLKRDGGCLRMVLTFEIDGHSFEQAFTAIDMDDDILGQVAAEVGLRIECTLDFGRTWVVLRKDHQ